MVDLPDIILIGNHPIKPTPCIAFAVRGVFFLVGDRYIYNTTCPLFGDCECVELIIRHAYLVVAVAGTPIHRTINHRSTCNYRPSAVKPPENFTSLCV